MNTNKLLLIVIFAILAIGLSAQPILIGFKDASPTTLNLVRLEAPDYPNPTPVAVRFHVEAYLSLDAVIDPITETGFATGDDSEFFTLYLNFGPGAGNLALNNLSIDPVHAGKYVYLRIFNATTREAATKYMSFHTPYLIPAPGSTVAPNIRPDFGWAEPTWTPLASTPPTFSLEVLSNYVGAAIWKDGTETGQVTPYTFDPAEAGLYTVVLPNVAWTPASYDYAGDADASVTFVGVLNPSVPAITYPENDQMFDWEAEGEISITWTAGAIIPAYYEIQWNGGDWLNVGMNTEWTTPELGEGAYNFKVRGVINDPAKAYTRARIDSRSFNANAVKGTGDYAEVSFSVTITPVLPEEVIINPDVELPANVVVGGAIPPALLGPDTGFAAQIYTITGFGMMDVTLFRPAAWGGIDWYAFLVVGGSVLAGPNPIVDASYTFVDVNFDAKGDVVVIINDNATLPVELSVFNAVLTAQKFVKLTWISESESNMLGYRVYRSQLNDANTAVQITPTLIEATNTSSTAVYSIEDREVLPFNSYYYWLEAVDFNHSNFFGPQFVTVTGEIVPELPVQTAMKNAYPNPFKTNSSTNIEVAVKAGETGTVTIYNVLGQVVKTYSVREGLNNLTWNGRDSKGNACGSGIYFYKLSTPSMNQTRKMVIVK